MAYVWNVSQRPCLKAYGTLGRLAAFGSWNLVTGSEATEEVLLQETLESFSSVSTSWPPWNEQRHLATVFSLKTQSNKTTWTWTEAFETTNRNKSFSLNKVFYLGGLKRTECALIWEKPSELLKRSLYVHVEERQVEKERPYQKC